MTARAHRPSPCRPTALFAFAAGWFIEWALIRHLYKRPLDTLLATWGVSLALQQAFRTFIGPKEVSPTLPDWLMGSWAPAEGLTLIYAYLGYDPDWARLSVGTVLQMDALERLFAEARYRWFDFTEGDGAHKEMFGTHAAACSSLVLLEPTLANRTLLGARDAFDASVSQAKALATRSGAISRIRALR